MTTSEGTPDAQTDEVAHADPSLDVDAVEAMVRDALPAARPWVEHPAVRCEWAGVCAARCEVGLLASGAGPDRPSSPTRSVQGLAALEILLHGLKLHRVLRRSDTLDVASVSRSVIAGDLLLARASALASDLGAAEATVLASVLADVELSVIKASVEDVHDPGAALGCTFAAAARFGGLGASVPAALLDELAATAHHLGAGLHLALRRGPGAPSHRRTDDATRRAHLHFSAARQGIARAGAPTQTIERFSSLCDETEARFTWPVVTRSTRTAL